MDTDDVLWSIENLPDPMHPSTQIARRAGSEIERLRAALSELEAPCTCHEAYSGRGMQDPQCPAGDYGDIAREALRKPPSCQHNIKLKEPDHE